MRYIQATCTGVGFITHQDAESFAISGYPCDIWITDETSAAVDWSTRVNGISLTKEQAQELIDQQINNNINDTPTDGPTTTGVKLILP
jgi:hypothetical protein